MVVHETGEQVFDGEVTLGSGSGRIEIVNRNGQPLSLDKSWRRVVTFDTRSAQNIEPLMHAIEVVLAALRDAGIEAFLAYGTLLGAVREGKLLGHDSDADLGYVSRHTHPVDVIRESFRLQRALIGLGYRITRYSALAFKVDVDEGDGVVRGLDVFGGFLMDGNLHLMGEIREPFEESWIFPLGTTTLEGRTFPAPADPDRLLTATYGPWRMPDPAFKFAPPATTVRRLNGWFRGLRVGRARWDRIYSRVLKGMPEPSPFIHWVAEHRGRPRHVRRRGLRPRRRRPVHGRTRRAVAGPRLPAAGVRRGGAGDRRQRPGDVPDDEPARDPAGAVGGRDRGPPARAHGHHRATPRRHHQEARSGAAVADEPDDAVRRGGRPALPGVPRRAPVPTGTPGSTASGAASLRRSWRSSRRRAPRGAPREDRCLDSAGRLQGVPADRGMETWTWLRDATGMVNRLRETRAGEYLDLRRRVRRLEAEVQECRALNIRLAELTDIVTELLLPVAARDEEKLAELLEKYRQSV